jgi:hypothetical protein
LESGTSRDNRQGHAQLAQYITLGADYGA